MLKRFLRILLIVALLAGSAVIAQQVLQARQQEQQAQQAAQIVDETTVAVGTLRVTVGATGTIIPARQAALLFELPGVVSEVLIAEGDSVRAGDVLARLDTADLQSAVENARVALDLQVIAYNALTAPAREADLAVAEAAVAAAQASVNAAYSSAPSDEQVELARLQTELARNQLWQAQLQRDLASGASPSGIDISSLIPDDVNVPPEAIDRINNALNGVLPQHSLPSAGSAVGGLNQAEYGVEIADANYAATEARGANVASVSSASAALVSAQAQLDRLLSGPSEADLQLAEIAVRQAELAVLQAEAALERAVISAPFDGVVGRANLTVGEPPPAEDPALLLVDTTEYYVDLAIDETDVVEMEVGQAVELRLDALQDEDISGHISRVALTPTVVGQLVSFPVRVTLDETDAPVRIGMSATATVIVNEIPDALILPNRFIRIDRDTQQAYATIERAAGRFEEVPIQLGLRNETESQVTAGLESGQRVVLLPRGTFDPFGGP
jgi:HlyD family secretion protein